LAQRYGDGSLFERGRVYYFQYFENGKPRQVSTLEERLDEAKKFRHKFLGKLLRGELNPRADKVTCGELLDDILRHVEENAKTSTAKVWKLVVEANLRPYFGHLMAATVSTDRMQQYRDKREAAGRSKATVNRELSILWTAFNRG
jgi:hypothetical protein